MPRTENVDDVSFPNHQFSEPSLLEKALTHRSASSDNNERLEYLGDAILGFLIADALYDAFPDLDEGALTRARAHFVNKKMLAEMAREYDVGAMVNLGSGERKTGGWRRDSILADTMEAILGAIYVDAGIDACRSEVMRWFATRLERFSPAALEKDAKTMLQEYLQARKQPLPEYLLVKTEGISPNETFTVACSVSLISEDVIATGRSRRMAEQAAARKAYTVVSTAE